MNESALFKHVENHNGKKNLFLSNCFNNIRGKRCRGRRYKENDIL